jgi:peptide/nickel transport system ATP-binding protein
MTENNVLVEIKDLHTYFHLAEGIVRAVNGVDLTVKQGRTLGIVGESGCGKSITAMSLMRLVPVPGQIEQGEILFHRSARHSDRGDVTEIVNITALEANGREMRSIRGNQISMVFQEPMTAMSPVRTVGRQIMEAIELHQQVGKTEARNTAIELLRRARLPNPERTIDDYPFQLSGGMRQRRAVAPRPAAQSGAHHRRLSLPVERWYAPAGRDRHGAELQPQPAHCR